MHLGVFASPHATRYTSEFQGDSSMSKLFCCLAGSLIFLSSVCNAAVVTFTVNPTPVPGTSGMVGAFGSNSFLARVEGNNIVANPTSLSAAGGSYAGGSQLKAYVNPYPAAPAVGDPDFRTYVVSSSTSAAWLEDVGLNFLSRSELISGSLTTDFYSEGQFFFSVVVSGGTGTYSISADGTQGVNNYAKLKYYDGVGFVDFTSTSGSISDLASKSFMIDFKSTVLSSASGGTHADPGLTITLSNIQTGGGQVPEPASIAVFGLVGFAGFAARRFRKK